MSPLPVATTAPKSLRRVFWLSFLPLTFVFLGSFGVILVQTNRVHRDIQRIFEESEEVGLTGTLKDEVRGIAAWVGRADTIPAVSTDRATFDLITEDARQHLTIAQRVIDKFREEEPDDPSRDEHQEDERRIVDMIYAELQALQPLLGTRGEQLRKAEPHVEAVTRAADALVSKIQDESRTLGSDLDQRSEDIKHLIVLLCVVTGCTLLGAAVAFRRRVLRPLAVLDQAARRIGDGQFDLQLAVHHRDELGTLTVTLQDMASRIRAHQQDLEQRVAQRSRELLRTARLADLGTLAAGVAHEINNPLAAIATCAEGLLRDRGTVGSGDDDRVREYLEIIGKEAMRARDTTARLLAFARPESGRREPVWLARELQEVATMLEHSARRSGVRIVVRTPEQDHPVLGDAADLRQVLFNLLKNALDASPANATIDFVLANLDDRVHVTVSDQGPGIDASLGDRIFEPFVTTKEPGAGTGLGLAISHRIVTDHKGSLRAENRTEGGARFVVDLPAFRQE